MGQFDKQGGAGVCVVAVRVRGEWDLKDVGDVKDVSGRPSASVIVRF